MLTLYFTPKTQSDRELVDEVLEDYSYEWDASTGCFSFEEQEDLVDSLESELQDIFNQVGINGHFEAEQ